MHPLNILWSNEYLKMEEELQLVQTICGVSNVMIDSGGFTAYNKGKEIKIEDYNKRCKDWFHGHVWNYVMLDKIKNPQGTRDNLKIMCDAGLRPMPVWVIGMREDEMPGLCDINPHVCIAAGVGAGGIPTADNYAWNRYQTGFKASNGRAKIHTLGFLRFPDVFRLPIFSGDSSSFMAGGRWGLFSVFSPQKGIVQIRKDEVFKDRNYLQYVLRCNTPNDVIYGRLFNATHRSFLELSTIYAHIKYSQFCLMKGFRYFWALSEKNRVTQIASVCAAGRKTYFDYQEAIRIHDHLTALPHKQYLEEVLPYLRMYKDA